MTNFLPSQGTAGRSASDQVAESIAQAIHEQRLEPGSKLGEDDLSDIFGVSRTVIRAALRSLEHVHLVSIRRNRGAFVAEPTIAEAREVFEARALLEPRMAYRAAERAGRADVDSLAKHIAQEHDCLAEGNTSRALHLSGLFHVGVARVAAQSTIADFVETLVGRSSLIINLYRSRQSALCESGSHQRLLEAIRDRRAADASAEMAAHIEDLMTSLAMEDRSSERRSLRDALLDQDLMSRRSG